MEQEAGNDNVGARLAIYFERKAEGITSELEILGDRAILQVVQTALGLPQQMSFSSLDRQQEMIKDRLDVEDLSDPEFVKDLTKRFLALWDINNPSSVSVPPLLSSGRMRSMRGRCWANIAHLLRLMGMPSRHASVAAVR